jgi:hypothetical protein
MPCWLQVNGDVLNQGDLLRAIKIPSVRESFPETDGAGNLPVDVVDADVIVMSQSCDLELRKLSHVLVAQAFSVDEFEDTNPNYKTKGRWTDVVRGRVEALHILTAPEAPYNPRQHLVVDFRLIASLPVGYVQRFATAKGDRWRLQPPYLEAFSHAFGHFFSRVALPDNIKM